MQELETRLRQHELQGIEASPEIQMAARMVAYENKKLRGLLAQNGIAEDSLQIYLQSSPTCNTEMEDQYGGRSASTQIMEQFLSTQESCCLDDNAATDMGFRGRTGSRESRVSTIQSGWDAQTNDQGLPGDFQHSSQVHHIMTPSIRTSGSSSMSLGHGSSLGTPYHQRSGPIQMLQHSSPASNSLSRTANVFEYDPQLILNTMCTNSQHHQAPKQYQSPNSPQRLSCPTVASSNVNSYAFAADMATATAGGDPTAVRADLGCLPALDYAANNHLVFRVVDRYNDMAL
jgi:hypothetical protein